jgi:hypothetical protein
MAAPHLRFRPQVAGRQSSPGCYRASSTPPPLLERAGNVLETPLCHSVFRDYWGLRNGRARIIEGDDPRASRGQQHVRKASRSHRGGPARPSCGVHATSQRCQSCPACSPSVFSTAARRSSSVTAHQRPTTAGNVTSALSPIRLSRLDCCLPIAATIALARQRWPAGYPGVSGATDQPGTPGWVEGPWGPP